MQGTRSWLFWNCTQSKKIFFLDWLTLEDGTDKLSRNVGNKLPMYTAYSLRRAQISFNPWRKPETTQRLSALTGQFEDPIKLTSSQVVKFNTMQIPDCCSGSVGDLCGRMKRNNVSVYY
jgi:nitrous oxidase accessory protein NosD